MGTYHIVMNPPFPGSVLLAFLLTALPLSARQTAPQPARLPSGFPRLQPRRPFPQHLATAPGTIRPSHRRQARQDDDSAFDGDCDMADALLLAEGPWGGHARLASRREALRALSGLRDSAVGPQSRLPLLGDWGNPGGATCKSVVSQVQADFTPANGLQTDFLVSRDGKHNDNACRDPWRLLSRLVLSGNWWQP